MLFSGRVYGVNSLEYWYRGDIDATLFPFNVMQSMEEKMKLKTVVLLMALSMFCSFANADNKSHRAATEELLFLTNVDKMLEPIWKQIEKMMEQQFVQMNAPEKLRPVLNKYSSKLVKVMEEELGWAKMKNDYIDIYVKTYTEGEIKAISEFYKSPAGKKFIEKMPQLMQESMAISQKNMPIFTEKMQKLFEEMVNEIKQLKEKQKE